MVLVFQGSIRHFQDTQQLLVLLMNVPGFPGESVQLAVLAVGCFHATLEAMLVEDFLANISATYGQCATHTTDELS